MATEYFPRHGIKYFKIFENHIFLVVRMQYIQNCSLHFYFEQTFVILHDNKLVFF